MPTSPRLLRLYWPRHRACQILINHPRHSSDAPTMQKSILFLIVAIVFGVLGFAFAKYCPLGSKLGPAQAKAQAETQATAAPDPNKPNAAQLATSAMSTVYTLRSQIALYRLQHNDEYPNFKKYGWKQFT